MAEPQCKNEHLEGQQFSSMWHTPTKKRQEGRPADEKHTAVLFYNCVVLFIKFLQFM